MGGWGCGVYVIEEVCECKIGEAGGRDEGRYDIY